MVSFLKSESLRFNILEKLDYLALEDPYVRLLVTSHLVAS